MSESTFVGLIMLIAGGLNVVRPDFLLRLQIWTQRVIMGARYEPSARTYFMVRMMGVLFVLIGFVAITGFLD